MIKKFTLLLVAMCLGVQVTHAVPADPKPFIVTQPDGTTLTMVAVGDEFQHGFTTLDGLTVEKGSDGYVYYRTANGLSQVKAHDVAGRNTAETAFINANLEQLNFGAQITAKTRQLRASARNKASKVGSTQVPTTGSPRVPIILVEYADKAMANSKTKFEDHYKTGNKSVFKYFSDQSNEQYTPQFDVYGIYTLDNNREYYGGNVYDSNGNRNDQGLGRMVEQAITKAGDEIDWSKYDNDGDGEADVCIVVYAGVGEAQASSTVPESIWPCQWSLNAAQYYGYGDIGAMQRNGVTINRFAVFNELNGSNDNGTTLDGIGTFCHEFSHCLGLPDFYDTAYGGHYGMGYWSLMCSGCYNGVQISGDTPVGYSAYEKNFMGWLNYIEAQENNQYTLPVSNSGNDMAVRIKALNNNEYFILENRRKQGWDQCIRGEGVLITHFTYMADRWSGNTPNNEDVQLATIIPADGTLSSYNESTDPYGKNNHEFTATSNPAMMANMSASGELAGTTGGYGTINKPVTDITIKADGTATFWYMKKAYDAFTPVMQPADAAQVTGTGFTAQWTDETADENVESYTLWVAQDGLAYDPVLLEEANFTATQTASSDGYLTNVASSYQNYLPAGWTCGNSLYAYDGCILIGDNIRTKSYDLPTGYDKISVVINGYNLYGDYYGSPTVTVTAEGSTASNSFEMSDQADYTSVLNASATEAISIEGSNYPAITGIKVYAGDVTEQANAPLLLAIETGDATRRIITGITGKQYQVNNLTAGGTFNYKVKTVYFDGTESAWSNIEQVTLADHVTVGDVNCDGEVNVNDVTTLVNYILGKNPTPFDSVAADVNEDTAINVNDVTALINLILNNH